MPRQIPAGLNWFEAPEAAAVRAHNENVAATATVYNAGAGLLYRDVDVVRAEADAIKAQFEASRDAAANMTVDPLVPELASYTNRNAYYDDVTAETPATAAASASQESLGEAAEQAVIPTTNHAADEDPGSAYKTMVEAEQDESQHFLK